MHFQLLVSTLKFSSVTKSCLTLCDPMGCSTPGLPVHHQLNGHEFEQLLGNSEGQGSLACCNPWRDRHNLATEQQQSVFLPGKSHRQWNLLSYNPWSCKRVGHNLVTKQQQQQQKFISLCRIHFYPIKSRNYIISLETIKQSYRI